MTPTQDARTRRRAEEILAELQRLWPGMELQAVEIELVERVWTRAAPHALAEALLRERARAPRHPHLERIGRALEITDDSGGRGQAVADDTARMRARRLAFERESMEQERALEGIAARVAGMTEAQCRALIAEGLDLSAAESGGPFNPAWRAEELDRLTRCMLRSLAAGTVEHARTAGLLDLLERALAARDRRTLLDDGDARGG